MVEFVPDLEFPVWGLLPKQETEVLSFLSKNPKYDGRNVTIAIFDSGVDPGAPGLQFTSTNERKIIERYDCSGCGDVNTSTIVQHDEEGFITGLTGRKLKIPDPWKKLSKDFRIGVKIAFELYPTKLKDRIEADRREKLWDVEHKVTVADATREFQKYESSSPKKNGDTSSDIDVLTKEEYEYRVEYLTNLDKKYCDLGPVYDCVVFHDGEMWRACIDTSEEGDLANSIFLGEYSKCYEYSPLTKADQLNISINVHDNGNVLEIVGLCSGHGTHVASIASAYFPNNPEKNGAAPGAQIISLTVGDGRLGSMETGTALVRAMIKVMELSKTKPVDIINMSYGEHANWNNTGRIGELMNEVVNKYGVIWVASAGNHGPALCTVGTPPDISQNNLIGVGAYVSPDMMLAEYSLRQKMPSMAYTWTSRGPTIDGDLGISICAPGAAITSVPNFTLRNAQLLNGTSMSAPHVAGAIALLLSGLKNLNLPYSPYNVKRALEATARFLEQIDPFAQGKGLLQVEKAFDYLKNYHTCPARNVRFCIQCGSGNAKGIHIRRATTNPMEINVTIEPRFEESDDIDPATKIGFGLQLGLINKAPYVRHPAFLDLQNLGRVITVKIDSSSLQPGVHSTCIEAYDINMIEKGSLFRIPVTVVKPIEFDQDSNLEMHFKGVNFKPNTLKRHFFLVPEHATWVVMRLRCSENGQQSRFVVHCMQLRPKLSCKAQEFQKISQVNSHSDTVLAFQVKGGLVLEVVVGKYWANIGDVDLDYSLVFHGVKPDTPNIIMQAVDGLYQTEVRCLKAEEIAPAITLKSSVQVLKPTDSKISPLSERDVIPNGRQIYELILTYEAHISKATEVMPNSPLLSDVLYESEFESQLWMLFDSNKQMLHCGDAYASKYVVKLERGDYVIKLNVRHEKKDLLEKLNEIPMLLSRKLSNSLSLDIYSSYSQAILQGKKMVSATILKGNPLPIYISPILNDKSKLSSIQGQYLVGTITYAKDELGKKVDTYPFKFIPHDSSKKSSSKTEKEKTKLEEYNESLRDLKTSFLSKSDDLEQAATLYEELKSAYPDHLAVHSAMMQCIDPLEIKKQLPLFVESQIQEQNKATYIRIICIADVIISAVDVDRLLSILAIKTDQRNDAVKLKNFFEKQKTALLDALSRKGIALCRLYLTEKNTASKDEMLETIKGIWKDVLKFIDPNDLKVSASNVLFFALWHAAVLQHYGRVLKYLGKFVEEKPQREIDEKCAEVCAILGWDHCVRYINKSLPIKYPSSYRPF